VKTAVLHGYGHDQPTCRKQTKIKERMPLGLIILQLQMDKNVLKDFKILY
jgi:hypothetical protein